MLTPPDPLRTPGTEPDEESIGQVLSRLAEDARAYAKAEVDLYRVIATEKARAHVVPVGLMFAAMLFLQSAVTVLCIGLFAVLIGPIGPMLAGLVAFLVALAIAGVMAWVAVNKLRRIWQ